ncbi:MAG: D-sedoheptulose 7-phosphate isomerase [Candidatus Aureabacteria bacterium]|nr:D-sedoheptulose 7-phosphate isomerase [Candidatus Auribacterota bacterium]
MRDEVVAQIEESAAVKKKLAAQSETVCRMVEMIIAAYRHGGRLLICGNGGSAADAQHIAGELVGRFLRERAPLDCMALTTDSSVLTAIGNDYGFEQVFSRQVTAHGRKGDLLLAISTSGNSPDVLKAVEEAQRLKMKVIALSGRNGGALARAADLCVTVPSQLSPRIQESHATIAHIICCLVERALVE